MVKTLCDKWMYLYLSSLNVSIKNGCEFYGLPLVTLDNESKITIGSNCKFRTASWSNSAGIKQRTYISANGKGRVYIGDNCGISGGVISSRERISIGNNVFIGVNCTIIDNDRHDLDYINRISGKEIVSSGAIEIKDNVWLGMNVVVLKGVSIGARSIVAANSVVTKNVPDGVLVAGNPAKMVRNLVSSD
ncbi:acyltransferase [Vibrio genomosp. F6]|uniref:acyltransferase n=1 Tax=Vibrio genomosp. F6 TaxID=723172 RepID=UPI00148312D4|nr:acyltransferase [Vibrio genomosp. F6]